MNQRKRSGRAADSIDTVGGGGVSAVGQFKSEQSAETNRFNGKRGRLQGAEPGSTAVDKTQS